MAVAQITSAAFADSSHWRLWRSAVLPRQYPKLKRSQVRHIHDHERIETTTRCTRHETTLMVERPSARSAPCALTPPSTGKLRTHTHGHPTHLVLRCHPYNDVTPSRCTRGHISPFAETLPSEARASLLPLISLPTIPSSMCTIHFHGPPLISDAPFTRIRTEIGFWQNGFSNHDDRSGDHRTRYYRKWKMVNGSKRDKKDTIKFKDCVWLQYLSQKNSL